MNVNGNRVSRAALTVAGALGAIMLMGLDPAEASDGNDYVESAQQTADLMTNALVAALLQIVDDTTADNVDEGNKMVSLIFGDRNDSIRLIGNFSPLKPSAAAPEDCFETDALALALQGQGHEVVENGELRRSIPLQFLASECALCHDSWQSEGLQLGDYVGALVINVPLYDEDCYDDGNDN